jgi:hypothetical protein
VIKGMEVEHVKQTYVGGNVNLVNLGLKVLIIDSETQLPVVKCLLLIFYHDQPVFNDCFKLSIKGKRHGLNKLA